MGVVAVDRVSQCMLNLLTPWTDNDDDDDDDDVIVFMVQ